MARETQKEKIARLEEENAQLEQRIAEYHKHGLRQSAKGQRSSGNR